MPQLTRKSFEEARELIYKFQTDAVKLPLEISTALCTGAAISFQRIKSLSDQTVLKASRPRPKSKRGK